MSHKSHKIAALIASLRGRPLDAHYLGFFECFNQGRFFEAHEVLEELWLAQRGQPLDRFYKGLIQLAGAFVHLQKRRRQPAVALFRLARGNLQLYPSPHERLEVRNLLTTIDTWVQRLSDGTLTDSAIAEVSYPKLSLMLADPSGPSDAKA